MSQALVSSKGSSTNSRRWKTSSARCPSTRSGRGCTPMLDSRLVGEEAGLLDQDGMVHLDTARSSRSPVERPRQRPSGAACASSGRRGMGRLPRKCKLRGPSRDHVGTLWGPCGYPVGSAYISPGPNWENPAKFRHNLAKI